jgi:Protein of unknown function (DUF2793)
MSDTTHLTLPLIEAAQAQKHVTHNEALAMIDGLLQLAVKSRALTEPPATPVDGDRYLVAAAPTGLWSGQSGKLAQYLAGLWQFRSPREGWRMWVDDENLFLVFDGGTWASIGVPNELQNMARIGISTTADVTNRFAVSSPAILFNHAGNNAQFKINKNALSDSASVLFQTGFSGRAEFGSTGDDDFHMKVSDNGSTFNEAIVLSAIDGRTTVKKTLVLEPQPAEPAAPVNGQLWYNSTSGKFRARQNGTSVDMIGGGAGGSAWGAITGTLSAQSDLQTALNAKLNTADVNAVTDARIAAASVNALADVVVTAATPGQVLKFNGANWINDADATASGGGSGDVVGPASAIDTAIALFSGTTGKIIQNAAVSMSANGNMRVAAASAVSTDPGSGNILQGSFNLAGRAVATLHSGNEGWRSVQRELSRSAISLWQPAGNSTGVPGILGLNTLSILGTATTRSVATTNRVNRQRRLGYVSATTVGALSGHYASVVQYTIGDGSGNGGFQYVCRFVVSDAAAVAGARMVVGLRNATAAPTNVEPNTLTNMVGVAKLSTSNNLHIVYGGSTAQAAIDLGANFPANNLSTDLYELVLYSPPFAVNTVHYRLTRVNTGDVVQAQLGPGTTGTTLPLATLFLGHVAWRTNNATALAVGLDVCGVYIEQLDSA